MSSALPPDPAAAVPEFSAPSFGGYAGEPNALPGVGFWPRAGARVIDTVFHYLTSIVSGVLLGIMLAIAGGGEIPADVSARLQKTSLAAFLFALIGSVAYHTICESVHGSTLGKFLIGARVVQEDGSPCRFKSALLRSIGYFVDALFFGIVGYYAMQRSPSQQRHGDHWADTVVYKRTALPPGSDRGTARFLGAFFLAVLADSALLLTGFLIQISG